MKRLLPILLLVFSAQVDAWNPKDLARLKATNECEECDLSGARLYRSNMPRALSQGLWSPYTEKKPKRMYLPGANLSGANLKEAYLYKAVLNRANLSGANLSGADLHKAYVIGSNLEGANLKKADLYWVSLNRSNLTDANLDGAFHFDTVDTAGAIFCRTVMPNGSTTNSGCSQGSQRRILVFMTQWSEMWWELLR
jgi:uncharacterized protein YjbI with pentapeptide repeats